MEEGVSFPFDLQGYTFLSCIGVGTYSTCFKVFSQHYQQFFCAKMTEIQDANFFADDGSPRDQELLALLQLDHQNVIKVYNYFRYDCFFFLILELCNGGTLADRIKENLSSQDQILSYMLDIIEALVFCHQQNIAHRDIKPQNIFIDEHHHAKVADFGLSSVLKARQDLVDTACGSPNYLAPEIYSQEAYDPFKADVFALGVTFYQMLVKKLPWPEEITTAGPERPTPVFPRMLGHNMTSLLKAMLDLDPNKRPTMEMIMNSPAFDDIRQRMEFLKKQATAEVQHQFSFRVTRSKELIPRAFPSTPHLSNNTAHTKIMKQAILTQSTRTLIGKKRRSSARIVSSGLTFDSGY